MRSYDVGELGELGDRYMAWHGMAWTDCKHTPVPCSSQSLQSPLPRFYSSFPLVHEDPEEAGNKKTINGG